MRIDPTDVPDGWRIARLGDIAEVRGGVGFPLERQGRREGAYPFIKVSDMNVGGNGTYIRSANNYVDQTDVSELGAHVFLPGTVVFPKVGAAIATNKKRVLTVPTIIDNNLMGVTVSGNDRCDSRFLHRWFTLTLLEKLANVSTVPSITSSRLKKQAILLPPIQEQRAIAEVFDSIDKAIESTDETVAATERLRDALLHELLTRGLPGQHSEWKEVPGLGNIPASWKAVHLGDVVDINRASWLPGDEEEIIHYLDLTAVFAPGSVAEPREIVSAEAPSRARRRVHSGDVLVSTVRPNLRGFARIARAINNLIASTGFAVLSPRQSTISSYIYHHVMTPCFAAYLENATTGQAYPAVRPADVAAYRLSLPPLPEQRAIAAVLDSVDAAIERAREERCDLRSLQASTADALLTGRVRVDQRK